MSAELEKPCEHAACMPHLSDLFVQGKNEVWEPNSFSEASNHETTDNLFIPKACGAPELLASSSLM